MAYTYTDYESQNTAAARLARARLFHKELTDKLGADVDSDGTSVRFDAITSALDRLQARLPILEAAAAAEGGNGTTYGSFAGTY